MIPKNIFLTKGVGKHKEYLQSFELALRSAGIQYCNLVSVSSIIPPNCKFIPREKGLRPLEPGEITYTVMSKNSTNEPNRLISASIGVALPTDKGKYDIYRNIIHSDKIRKWLETMQRIWQPQCWLPQWESNLIQKLLGMKGNKYSRQLV